MILPKHPSYNNFRYNLLQFEIQMPTIMLARKALKKKNINFDPQVFASEEYCLSMQLIINEKVSVIYKPLAIYMVRTESLTNKHISRWAFERRYTLNRILEKYPGIDKEYTREFKEAFFRSNYYEAEYLMSINKKKEAIKMLRPAIFFSWKYFAIYILMNLPISFWNYFQKAKYKRR